MLTGFQHTIQILLLSDRCGYLTGELGTGHFRVVLSHRSNSVSQSCPRMFQAELVADADSGHVPQSVGSDRWNPGLFAGSRHSPMDCCRVVALAWHLDGTLLSFLPIPRHVRGPAWRFSFLGTHRIPHGLSTSWGKDVPFPSFREQRRQDPLSGGTEIERAAFTSPSAFLT